LKTFKNIEKTTLIPSNELKMKIAYFQLAFTKTLSVVKPSIWWQLTVLTSTILPISQSRIRMRY